MRKISTETADYILQVIKIIPVLIILGGLFVFQVDWIQSAQQVEFVYDFSAYSSLFAGDNNDSANFDFEQLGFDFNFTERSNDINHFIQNILIISNLTEPGVNLTQAEDLTFDNSTLRNDLAFGINALSQHINWSEFNEENPGVQTDNLNESTIIPPHVYHAIKHGDFWDNPEYKQYQDLFKQFIYQFWNNTFTYLIPDEWKKPIEVEIINYGYLDLKNIHIAGELVKINNKNIILFNESIKKITPSENYSFNIDLNQVIQSIKSLVLDDLVNYSIDLIKRRTPPTFGSFMEHLERVIKSSDLVFNLVIKADFGILPLQARFIARLSDVLK